MASIMRVRVNSKGQGFTRDQPFLKNPGEESRGSAVVRLIPARDGLVIEALVYEEPAQAVPGGNT